MKTQEPASLGSQLQGLFGRRQWHVLWQAYTISRNWRDLVGSEIAARSAPACIQKNILWVSVRDSVWMQHLQAMKPQILERVRAAYPEADIRDIRWQLWQAEPPAAGPGDGGWARVEPDPDEARAFAAMTATIDNKECREALYRLWLALHQHQEQR